MSVYRTIGPLVYTCCKIIQSQRTSGVTKVAGGKILFHFYFIQNIEDIQMFFYKYGFCFIEWSGKYLYFMSVETKTATYMFSTS